uniref:Cytochrome c-type protein n=1 Tax=Magnetococcus massalia (strain MO-1) TaxID=451514 RepID=A0A1S7LEL2_MAGMO|nr:putative Cytochrome c-type protein TorC/TorY [Candidatus Magnetococcus massalia]
MQNLWRWLGGQGNRAGLLIGGLALGVIFWGGFNTFMEYTNTYEFCVSCHEMTTVNEEYQKSAHAHNPSGVAAVCSDCHVPEQWTAKLVRKIKASNELWHKLLGTIDTPEKFEAKRLELAQNVWQEMLETDSRECRNCHSEQTMVSKKQTPLAQKMHTRLLSGEATCINCHKGVAHQLPGLEKLYVEMEQGFVKQAQSASLQKRAVVITPKATLAKGEDGKGSFATLYGGTPVEVVAERGGMVQVNFAAWDRESGTQMYVDFNRAIMVAKLSFDGMDALKVLESKVEPEYELTWNRGQLTGWVKREALGPDEQAYWNYVTGLYDLDCNMCHKTFPRDKWNIFDWTNNIKEMRRYTKLSPEQLEQILGYVLRGARNNSEG